MEIKYHVLSKSLFQDIVKSFNLLARKKNITLQYVPLTEQDLNVGDDKNWALQMDKGRIDQVVRNLLSNAIKFSPRESSIMLKMSSRRIQPDDTSYSHSGVKRYGELVVEIADQGAGIDSSHLHKLFGQFTQFNRNELQGGGRMIHLFLLVRELPPILLSSLS